MIEERARRAHLANIRQELLAPVGAIVGYAEILHEQSLNEDLTEMSGDLERVLSLVLVEGCEHERRDASEVVGVEVRHQDGVDFVALDAELVQAGERGHAGAQFDLVQAG